MKKSQRRFQNPISTPPLRDVLHPGWVLGGMVWSAATLIAFLYNVPPNLGYVPLILDTWASISLFHFYTLKVLGGFAVAGFLLWTMAQSGRWILARWMPPEYWRRDELWASGLALGAGLASVVMMGLGGARLWLPGVIGGVVAITALSVIRFHYAGQAPVERPLVWRNLWTLFAGLFAIVYLAGGAAPEIFYDSLHYHLAVPNLFRMNHRLFAIPTMLYSSFVMTVQMLYGLALTLGNTFTAKGMHLGFSVGLAVTFIALGRKLFGSRSGIFAALLFLSMPIVMINATTAGTDVAGTFFFMAATLMLVRALETGTLNSFRLAGALMGFAASCKYPAFVFIPVTLVVMAWHRRGEGKAWREFLPELIHFTLFAALALAPVLLKNALLYHNPIYPFGGLRFGSPRVDPVDWTYFISDANARNLRGEFSSVENAWHFIAHPWFITMGNSGTIGPLLLMGLPWLFAFRRPSSMVRTLRRLAGLLWLAWLLTSMVPRYGLPPMALCCLLMAEPLLETTGFFRRFIVLGAFAVGLLANLYLQNVVFLSSEGWRVIGGQLSEDAYLGRMHATYPTPPYDALVWMNQHLPDNAVVLFAGESRSFYLERRSIPSSIPGPQPIVRWSKEALTSDELAERFQRAGVTYIFLNLVEAVRTDGYHVFNWDKNSWLIFDDFWARHTRLAWKSENNSRDNPQALYVFEFSREPLTTEPHTNVANPFARWAPK
jgi:hypothetical protein